MNKCMLFQITEQLKILEFKKTLVHISLPELQCNTVLNHQDYFSWLPLAKIQRILILDNQPIESMFLLRQPTRYMQSDNSTIYE